MKKRILRVLMLFATLFAIGFTLFISIIETKNVLIAAGFGISAIAAVATIQYILLGEWHPMHLFGKNEKD